MRARIPLSPEGNIPRLSLAELSDVGRFTAAVCLLPKGAWKKEFNFVGETVRMNDVAKIVEKVRGQKMDVRYCPYKDIGRRGEGERCVAQPVLAAS